MNTRKAGKRKNMVQSIEETIKRLMDVLPEGGADAIPAGTLCGLMGIEETRDLRRLIHKARWEFGKVICSTPDGYFKPNTRGELLAYIKRWNSHSDSIKRSLVQARELLSRMEST